MEKTNHSAIISLKLSWNDLGCWTSIADACKSDEKNNVILGNTIMKEREDCLISCNLENKPFVAAIGIKEQIIVSTTTDAILVVDKAYTPEFRVF